MRVRVRSFDRVLVLLSLGFYFFIILDVSGICLPFLVLPPRVHFARRRERGSGKVASYLSSRLLRQHAGRGKKHLLYVSLFVSFVLEDHWHVRAEEVLRSRTFCFVR